METLEWGEIERIRKWREKICTYISLFFVQNLSINLYVRGAALLVSSSYMTIYIHLYHSNIIDT